MGADAARVSRSRAGEGAKAGEDDAGAGTSSATESDACSAVVGSARESVSTLPARSPSKAVSKTR